MFRPNGHGGASKGSCSNDYIQSWLEKTQRRPEWEPPAERPLDEEVPWRPHDLGAVDIAMPSQPSNFRKRRRGSFDSSIIPDQPRRRERRTLPTTMSNRPSTARAHRNRGERGGSRRSATMSPAPRQDDAGPFEKRARHKTRPDRYETRKRTNAGDGDGKQKARRTKTLGKKKLVSSREVMDNFTSDAILTEGRLTVKPALTPGLYGNVRCGSRNELPDLAYNSMEFLAHTKRRDDRPEESREPEPREGRTRESRGMRDSSPLLVPRSESRDSIHGRYSGGGKEASPPAWHRSYKGIPETARPNTAPVEIESTYEPPRLRRYHGPARAASSLDSPGFSVPDQSPPHGPESPCKGPGGYDRSTPESMGRLLWETGVFDGLERARKSTFDKHQRLEIPTGGRSQHQGTETPVRKRARCADKSATATLPGAGEGPAFRPPTGPPAAAQADGAHRTSPEMPESRSEDHVGPVHPKSSDLPTTQAAAIAVGGAPVDRAKIALMAHIPVYCHQECQTESPRPVPQKPKYVQAGTQTAASPAQHCRRCQVSGDAQSSPVQRQGPSEELLVAGEPQDASDCSSCALDGVDPGIFRSYPPDRHEEILFQLASGRHQGHPAFQGQVDLEAQPRLFAGYDGVENLAPLPWRQPNSHLVGRDATALSFVTPVENGIHDEESPRYPWGHGGHMESQGAGLDMSYDGAVPIHRHVDAETRTYHPYPVRYRTNGAAAVQPSNQEEFGAHPHRQMLGAHVEEPYLYSQDMQYPSEQLPRPSRPRISSPARDSVPLWECDPAGHGQDENQINMGGPSHLQAHQRQMAQEDLEQAHIEARWRERQLEFARRYGY